MITLKALDRLAISCGAHVLCSLPTFLDNTLNGLRSVSRHAINPSKIESDKIRMFCPINCLHFAVPLHIDASTSHINASYHCVRPERIIYTAFCGTAQDEPPGKRFYYINLLDDATILDAS